MEVESEEGRRVRMRQPECQRAVTVFVDNDCRSGVHARTCASWRQRRRSAGLEHGAAEAAVVFVIAAAIATAVQVAKGSVVSNIEMDAWQLNFSRNLKGCYGATTGDTR